MRRWHKGPQDRWHIVDEDRGRSLCGELEEPEPQGPQVSGADRFNPTTDCGPCAAHAHLIVAKRIKVNKGAHRGK